MRRREHASLLEAGFADATFDSAVSDFISCRRRKVRVQESMDPQNKSSRRKSYREREGIQRSNSWPDLNSLDGLAYVVRLLTGKTYY